MPIIVPAQTPWKRAGAKIVFVGEAPADEEILDGFPAVGATGRTLDQLLRTANMTRTDDIPADFYPEVRRKGLRPILWRRSQYLITNVFDRQLPDNDIKTWCQPKAPDNAAAGPPGIQGSGWLQEQHWPHLKRLADEIREAKPTLIVPMGATALWAFTGSTSIANSRGAVGWSTLVAPNIKLLPIFHPAAIVRDWKMFTPTVGDLIKASYESTFPSIKTTDREIWVEPTLQDIEHFKANYLDNAQQISVDIETAGGQITCIGFAPDKHRALVIPFVDYRRPNKCYWPNDGDEVTAWDLVNEICQLPAKKLLQNGVYDLYWLKVYAKISVRNYAEDTRLMHHALYPELPKSLAFMGASYANEGAWKTMRQRRSDKRDE